MLDIGWRTVMVAVVFLVDLIVFADLARAEFSGLERKRARRPAPPLGTDHAPAAAEREGS